jgi:PhzF family phenazine biosynthesis protein
MIPLYTVDAFTERPFAGNSAAICLLDRPREDAWLAALAREMNLSETAYLSPRGADWDLRWFTPAVEVVLCGHATLASAHVLWESGRAGLDAPIRFHTRSGELTARRSSANADIELDFPAEPALAAELTPALAAALGIAREAVEWCGRNRMDQLLMLIDETAVRALAPDFPALAAATRPDRGVIVTARSADPRFDFVSRYFAPAAGVDEDPATGSAHCCLGPFWAERLGKQELRAYQASARGGELRVRVRGARVDLIGRAVTVLRGELADGAV